MHYISNKLCPGDDEPPVHGQVDVVDCEAAVGVGEVDGDLAVDLHEGHGGGHHAHHVHGGEGLGGEGGVAVEVHAALQGAGGGAVGGLKL